MNRALVLFENEVMTAAGKERIVKHIAAALVPDKGRILHHIPTVFRVERALGGGLSAAGNEVTLKEEVSHRACRVAYTACAIESTILNNAVSRDEERTKRKPRLVGLF
jgi:hypothetical protein